MSLGGAIIEQNMKLPLTIIEYYDKKMLYFTNALVYHYETLCVQLRGSHGLMDSESDLWVRISGPAGIVGGGSILLQYHD